MTTSAQNLGKQLEEKREQLGFTLKDVAEQTRIRKVYLESIEQGQLQNLPGQAYVTGFIRVYARHLGLDSDELLSRLEPSQATEASQPSALKPADNFLPQSEAQPRASSSWGAFWVGFLVVLVFGALIYFMVGPFDFATPPVLTPKDLSSSQKTSPPQQDATVIITKKLADSAPDITSDAGPVAEGLEAAEGTVDEEMSAGGPLPTVATGGSALRMLALAESSLIIYIDDSKPREYALHPGLDLTWDIREKARIELAEVGVARFWLDHEELKLVELQAFQLSTAPGE